MLGMLLPDDENFLWIAEESLLAPLPEGELLSKLYYSVGRVSIKQYLILLYTHRQRSCYKKPKLNKTRRTLCTFVAYAHVEFQAAVSKIPNTNNRNERRCCVRLEVAFVC